MFYHRLTFFFPGKSCLSYISPRLYPTRGHPTGRITNKEYSNSQGIFRSMCPVFVFMEPICFLFLISCISFHTFLIYFAQLCKETCVHHYRLFFFFSQEAA